MNPNGAATALHAAPLALSQGSCRARAGGCSTAGLQAVQCLKEAVCFLRVYFSCCANTVTQRLPWGDGWLPSSVRPSMYRAVLNESIFKHLTTTGTLQFLLVWLWGGVVQKMNKMRIKRNQGIWEWAHIISSIPAEQNRVSVSCPMWMLQCPEPTTAAPLPPWGEDRERKAEQRFQTPPLGIALKLPLLPVKSSGNSSSSFIPQVLSL